MTNIKEFTSNIYTDDGTLEEYREFDTITVADQVQEGLISYDVNVC